LTLLSRSIVPGKPPSDFSAIPTGTTTIKVTWSNNSSDWLIHYRLVDDNNVTLQNASLLANKTTNEKILVGLEKFAYYIIWMQSVTPWGYGIGSREILVKTLEEGIV